MRDLGPRLSPEGTPAHRSVPASPGTLRRRTAKGREGIVASVPAHLASGTVVAAWDDTPARPVFQALPVFQVLCGLLCLGTLLARPASAPAEERGRLIPPSVLPGLGAADPRRPVDQEALPWRALGRVQHELGGRCTGVLIGPRTVLTAAHCLVSPRSFALVQPGSLHFLLGYRQGGFVAHARVAGYAIGPGFVPATSHASRAASGADWAVLTLATPIDQPGRMLPLLREAPPPRTPLMLGGYQQDRPETVMADTGCRAIGLERDAGGRPLLRHDCASPRGSSGGPVLSRGPDGGWGVAGIASSVALEVALGIAVPAQSIPR